MDRAIPSTAIELLKSDVTFVYAFFHAAELEARATERYVLVALGGIYSYLATREFEIPHHLFVLGWYAPALLVTFAAIRALGLLWRQKQLLDYLREIAGRIPLPSDVPGWVRSYDKHPPLIAISAATFYVLLITATWSMAYCMTR